MRAPRAALALLLLSGCSERPRHLLIDSSFGSSRLEAIDTAAEAWEVAADDFGAVIYMHVVPLSRVTLSDWQSGPRAIYAIESSGKFYAWVEAQIGPFRGAHSDGSIAIAVDRVPDAAAFGRVVRHELGHALGLDHASDGLMGPDWGIECIDTYALAAYCDGNPCGDGAAPECESDTL